MDLFSVFKGTHRWGRMIHQLLMISLWCSVFIFFAIAIVFFMGGWEADSLRIAVITGGVAVMLAFFTLFLQKSIHVDRRPETIHEYYECALLLEETKGLMASKKIYYEMLNRFDKHLGPAYLSLAAIELEQGLDREAEAYIEQAAKEDWVWYLPGLEMLADYYQHEKPEKLAEINEKIQRVKKVEEKASAEIYYFNEQDHFQSARQYLETFSSIVQILQSYVQLQELYIVKKQIESIPDRNVYAFAVVVDEQEDLQALEEKIYQDCYDQLAQPLGKYVFFAYTVSFLFLSKEKKQDQHLLQILRKIPGAKYDLTL